MPRPVVPIRPAPRASSRSRSSWPCSGRISGAFSATIRLSGEMATPWPRTVSISRNSAQGSTTTPLPMMPSLPGRTTPEGSRLSLKVRPPMTSVWPALWPPWKRTTTSARSDSQSTILPLPSSPHWAPTTATLAMSVLDPFDAAGEKAVAAALAPGLGHRIVDRRQPGDGDPALGPQAGGRRLRHARRQEQAGPRDRRRQGPEQAVEIDREAGRGFAAAAGIAAAAAELAARLPGEEREADAGIIFDAAMLDRVDGQHEVRRHAADQPGDLDQAGA